MVKGECNCGAIRFAIDAAVSDVIMCHCSICQKSTGSNGVAVVIASKDNFKWIRGEDQISTWKKPGHDWQTWFCSNCGSSLPGINDETRMYVPAGLIMEGGESLKVAHHIWVDSKAPWDEIGDSGMLHPESYEG